MLELKWMIFIVYVIISELVFVPLYFYWAYRFYQQRNHIAINKRLPWLTLFYSLFSLAARMLERPLYLFTTTYGAVPQQVIHEQTEIYPNGIVALYIIWTILFSFTQISTAWVLFLRYWLLFFNIRWTQSTLSKTWKIHINHLEIEQNWFLRHKSDYGSYKYTIKRVGIVYLTVGLLVMCLSLFGYHRLAPSIGSAIGLLLAIIPLFGIFVLAYKIRKFKDNFHVIKEFNVITIYIATYSIMYIIVGGIIPSLFDMDQYYRNLMVLSVSTIWGIFFMYFQTMYVLKIIKDDQLLPNESMGPELSFSGSGSARSHSGNGTIDTIGRGTTKSVSKSSATKRLSSVLRNEDDFESFMLHLSKEWSMEILLAVVEITQFQASIKNYYQQMESAGTDDMELTNLQKGLLENKGIPQSFIVYHEKLEEVLPQDNVQMAVDDKMIEFKIRACALYNKYVIGQELEINISYEQRQQLFNFMNNKNYFIQNVNMNATELFSMYDEVIAELSRLLNHSYCRFVEYRV